MLLHKAGQKVDEARGVFNKKSRTFVRVGQDFVSIFAVPGVFYAPREEPLACEASALTTELTALNLSILTPKIGFVNKSSEQPAS